MGHNTQRHIELTLPLRVIERELKKYNDRGTPYFNTPSASTWPNFSAGKFKKKNYKDLTKLIIKFKRRERWELFKAEHSAYIDYVREAATIPETPVTFWIEGKMRLA